YRRISAGPERRDPSLRTCRRQGGQRCTETGDARGCEAGPETRRYDSGEIFSSFRSAGEAGGMETHLQAWRREGCIEHTEGRLELLELHASHSGGGVAVALSGVCRCGSDVRTFSLLYETERLSALSLVEHGAVGLADVVERDAA